MAVFGAGSAGSGISALIARAMIDAGLSEAEAYRRFYLVDRDGLLVEGMSGLQSFQMPFAQRRDRLSDWKLETPAGISFADVISNAKPTVLIGTSGQPNAFTESIVRDMARHVRQPIIFPLSNPTERSEATPAELDSWTEGRAVIGTGSPFPPLKRNGKVIPYRSDEQCLRLSWYRSWRDCDRFATNIGRHVSCCCSRDCGEKSGDTRFWGQSASTVAPNS